MNFRKAHFIGIAGKGMSATALLLKQMGVAISGSDEGFYPPVSDYLKEANIPFAKGYRKENIPDDADVIIIGKNAKLKPESNAEVAAAIPVLVFLRTMFGKSKVMQEASSAFRKQVDYLAWGILVLVGCALVYSIGSLLLSIYK